MKAPRDPAAADELPGSRPRDHSTPRLEIHRIQGLPEFHPGDDLAAAIAHVAPWLQQNDVLVVTSKVVSKTEGRLVPLPANPATRAAMRHRLVGAETTRIVADNGRTPIVENRLGLVQAAAGIDASNVAADELALLPVDPDASASELRAALRARLGVNVGVVVTDTMGRPWRKGQTDVAIGASGLQVLRSYAGACDAYGNELAVTEVALADQIAAAADLVKGKLALAPAAVVRGLTLTDDSSCARSLLRPLEEDLFRLGTDAAIQQGHREAVLLRRSIRAFADTPVDPAVIRHAVGVALTAPAPHHTKPIRFVWLRSAARRKEVLAAMRDVWASDLAADGLADHAIERRIARGDLLYRAPELVVPFLVADSAHQCLDRRRQGFEHTMFQVAGGAAVQALLVALAGEGLGSCWVGSTIFAPEAVRTTLDVPESWEPLGAIVIGYPGEGPLSPRQPEDPGDALREL